MIDTWVGLVDGVARQFADFVVKVKSFGKSFRFWYYLWLLFLILTSLVTITFAQPGALITIVGVISIFAFVFYIPALWYLNYVKLPKIYPKRRIKKLFNSPLQIYSPSNFVLPYKV